MKDKIITYSKLMSDCLVDYHSLKYKYKIVCFSVSLFVHFYNWQYFLWVEERLYGL